MSPQSVSPQSVFGLFLVLGVLWTGIWLWVLNSTRQSVPYETVSSHVAVLRRRLLYALLIALGIAFLGSMRWLPYRPVRATTLGAPQVTVEVTSLQWAWVLSQNEVPAGVPVEFAVTAQDVNHGFGVYSPDGQLLTQVQAMPGYTNRLIYVFQQPGTYTIRCLEYCGLAHHAMVTQLTVR